MMQTKLVLLSGLASCALASFQIPAGHANGVYIYDAATGTHSLIKDIPNAPASTVSAIASKVSPPASKVSATSPKNSAIASKKKGVAGARNSTVSVREADEGFQNPHSAKFGRSSLTYLPNGDETCFYVVMTALDYSQVTYGFTQSCTGQTLPSGQSLYAYYDGFAAAMCNDGGPNPCKSYEFNGVMHDLISKCGSNNAGFEYTKIWKKGYGIYPPNHDLC